jgi:protein involved in polysaccharide export with SLBB domain
LDSTVVDLAVGPEALPASLVSDSPTEPFAGRLAPGDDAVAVYVFALPDASRGASVVTVSIGAGSPTVALPITL